MAWFRKLRQRLLPSSTEEKKDIPEGVWTRCPSCRNLLSDVDLQNHQYVCAHCGHHFRATPEVYFRLLFDDSGEEETGWTVLFEDLRTIDILNFTDRKPYLRRIEEAEKKAGTTEAMVVATGMVYGHPLTVACMNFAFIGGSMGSVVGERFARAVEHCVENRMPLLAITQTGGARMMESAFSLMQMAKTSAVLHWMKEARLPYWVLLTDPTTGGVTASFGMLGDVTMAEPGALIGFAGPRVIRETMKRDLPEGFQRSEFLQEHGFVDVIVDRRKLKEEVGRLMRLFAPVLKS